MTRAVERETPMLEVMVVVVEVLESGRGDRWESKTNTADCERFYMDRPMPIRTRNYPRSVRPRPVTFAYGWIDGNTLGLRISSGWFLSPLNRHVRLILADSPGDKFSVMMMIMVSTSKAQRGSASTQPPAPFCMPSNITVIRQKSSLSIRNTAKRLTARPALSRPQVRTLFAKAYMGDNVVKCASPLRLKKGD